METISPALCPPVMKQGNQGLISKLELAPRHGQTAQLKVVGSRGTLSLCISSPVFWMDTLASWLSCPVFGQGQHGAKQGWALA